MITSLPRKRISAISQWKTFLRVLPTRWRRKPASIEITSLSPYVYVPSVLWHCWLGGRKGIRSVKTERWGAGVVICLERGADLHMAQLMPLPLTVSCFSKIQIGFTFLVPAHPSSPGQGPLNVCLCVLRYTWPNLLVDIVIDTCNIS